jgi:hypothetical protein
LAVAGYCEYFDYCEHFECVHARYIAGFALKLPTPQTAEQAQTALRALSALPRNDKLAPYGVEARHPDEFVLSLIDLAPGAVASIVVQQAAALKNPPRSPAELLETLREQGLIRSVARLRELLGAIGE